MSEPKQPRTTRHTIKVQQSWVDWLIVMREITHQRNSGVSLNKGKDRVILGHRHRMELSVLTSSKQIRACVKGSTSGLHCKVGLVFCFLGNTNVKTDVQCCIQKSFIWCSEPRLSIKTAFLCQSDLNPPGKRGIFLSYGCDFKQQSFW